MRTDVIELPLSMPQTESESSDEIRNANDQLPPVICYRDPADVRTIRRQSLLLGPTVALKRRLSCFKTNGARASQEVRPILNRSKNSSDTTRTAMECDLESGIPRTCSGQGADGEGLRHPRDRHGCKERKQT